MSEQTSALSTFVLVQNFLQVSKEYEAIIDPSMLRHPHWALIKKLPFLQWIREKEKARRGARCEVFLKALMERYKGVSYQIFTRVKSPDEFGKFQRQVGFKIQIVALTLRDYRLFSPTLWETYKNLDVEVNELKPKFMLRQFVDEIPETEPRTTLLLMRYLGGVHALTAVDGGVRKVLERAYALLHQQVESYCRGTAGPSDDLERLTAGVFVCEHISGLQPPYRQYHEWLS